MNQLKIMKANLVATLAWVSIFRKASRITPRLLTVGTDINGTQLRVTGDIPEPNPPKCRHRTFVFDVFSFSLL